MKRGPVIALVLIASTAVGAGCFYKFAYEPQNGPLPFLERFSKSSDSSREAISVDSVASIAGIPNSSGIMQRYAGVVETQEEWKAKTEGERKIAETYVAEGDMVEAGDPLFTYDVTTDEQTIEKNRIALERLANDDEAREKKIDQYEKQIKAAKEEDEKLSLQTQILSEQNQIKQNAYDAKTTTQDIENLEKGIENATVRSEIDGIVKSVGKKSSSMSNGEDDAYVTVMAVGDLRVKAYANEQNVDSVQEGMAVVAYSRVNPELKWYGTVTTIKREGEKSTDENSYYGGGGDDATTSSKYPFYVVLDDTDGLMLGQHLYLEEDVGQDSDNDGIWMEDYYFEQEDDGTWFAWVEGENGKIEKRTVELGQYDEVLERYEVLSGLDADDYVAVPGQEPKAGDPTVRTEYADESAWVDYEYGTEGWDETEADFSSWENPEYQDGGMYYGNGVYEEDAARYDDSTSFSDDFASSYDDGGFDDSDFGNLGDYDEGDYDEGDFDEGDYDDGGYDEY